MNVVELFGHFCLMQDQGRLRVTCPYPANGSLVDVTPAFCSAMALLSGKLKTDYTASDLEQAVLAGTAMFQADEISLEQIEYQMAKVVRAVNDFGDATAEAAKWN